MDTEEDPKKDLQQDSRSEDDNDQMEDLARLSLVVVPKTICVMMRTFYL